MNFIKEIETFKLSDAVTFNDTLNPKLFNGTTLRPEVQSHLETIAADFIEEMGLKDFTVKDITISGSNAAYSYTAHSDIDLHVLVDMSHLPEDDVYRELFNYKKSQYNETHDLTIRKIPVELYVQDASKPVVSVGEYSIMNSEWIKKPTKRRANFDQTATVLKYEKLATLADHALRSRKIDKVSSVIKTIHRYRQAGLSKGGEFSPENLIYKSLRTQGVITKLYALRDRLHSKRLSIEGQYATESASGYIPSNAQKNDPRWMMALTQDIKPDTMQKNAKKFGWAIKRDGTPPTLGKKR